MIRQSEVGENLLFGKQALTITHIKFQTNPTVWKLILRLYSQIHPAYSNPKNFVRFHNTLAQAFNSLTWFKPNSFGNKRVMGNTFSRACMFCLQQTVLFTAILGVQFHMQSTYLPTYLIWESVQSGCPSVSFLVDRKTQFEGWLGFNDVAFFTNPQPASRDEYVIRESVSPDASAMHNHKASEEKKKKKTRLPITCEFYRFTYTYFCGTVLKSTSFFLFVNNIRFTYAH